MTESNLEPNMLNSTPLVFREEASCVNFLHYSGFENLVALLFPYAIYV